MTPARLAKLANADGRGPRLSADSDLEAVCACLQWCDPNGCHTQELFENDFGGGETYDGDVSAAWDAVAEMMEG